MSSCRMEPELALLYRRFMQQQTLSTSFRDIYLPPGQILLRPEIQQCLAGHFFDNANTSNMPFSYWHKFLGWVIESIEEAIIDPDEEEVSGRLYSIYATASSGSGSRKFDSAKTSRVYYHPPTPVVAAVDHRATQPIVIEENRNIIGSAANIGRRTWDAALHLAHHLHNQPSIAHNKLILELGAGTGLLSLFLASTPNLAPSSILATDGNPRVVADMQHNLELNAHLLTRSKVDLNVMELDWGSEEAVDDVRAAILGFHHHNNKSNGSDNINNNNIPNSSIGSLSHDILILGADVTYDPSICLSLAHFLSKLTLLLQHRHPHSTVEIILAATIRNISTLTTFLSTITSEECGLQWEKVQPTTEGSCSQEENQLGLFHSCSADNKDGKEEIEIYRIWRPLPPSGDGKDH